MDEQLKMTHCFQHRFIHYKWRGRNDVGHLADLFVQYNSSNPPFLPLFRIKHFEKGGRGIMGRGVMETMQIPIPFLLLTHYPDVTLADDLLVKRT